MSYTVKNNAEKIVSFDAVETIELSRGGPSIQLDMSRVSADTINTAAMFGFKRKLYNFFNTARTDNPANALADTIKHVEDVIYAGLWLEIGSRVSRSAPKTFEEFCASRNAARLVEYLDINSKNKKASVDAKAHRKALVAKGYDPDATSTGERLLVLLARQNDATDRLAWNAWLARKASAAANADLLDELDGLDMGGNA